MILKKIYMENLRSYETQEINFSKGSTLLSGDIGAGKTTILLAIEFALFGLQPSQKGNSLLRTGKDEAKVILEFEIDNQNIIIERRLKKTSKSISQDYASIIIDDEKFEGSITEIKSKVLSLLNYPAEFAKKTNLLYKFTVYTPQEEMKQIILEPGDIRLNTLRHVFGIDKYKTIEENASILTARLREKVRINEGILYDLEENKTNLDKKKENLINLKEKSKEVGLEHKLALDYKNLKQKFIEEIREKIDKKKEFENEISKTTILISEKKQQVTTLGNTINNLNLQIEESRKISFNPEEIVSLTKAIKFQEDKWEELQKEYMGVASNINSKEEKKFEVENLKNKISALQKCPTCLQEVSEQYKSNILSRTNNESEELKLSIKELTIKKIRLMEEMSSVKKLKEEFKSKKYDLDLIKIKFDNLKEKEQRITEIEKQKQLIQKDLEMLEKHTLILNSSVLEYEQYEKVFEEGNREFKKASLAESEKAIKKAETNKEVQFLEIQIKEGQEQINKKQDLKKKNERLREIEFWISEKFLNLMLFTEKQVMLTLKEEFSKLFSKWFAILVSDTLSAKLDDDFSPIIEQQDYELDYSFLSGGERTAIALAYRLSLNQVINSLLSKIKTRNLVILDEPTEGFSSQQLDKMKEVLQQLKTEQLIIVSHESKIEDFVENIIKFKKQAGITSVEG
ncbi:MAG: AAA family ATPase [Nanoarchaeota archaeon]